MTARHDGLCVAGLTAVIHELRQQAGQEKQRSTQQLKSKRQMYAKLKFNRLERNVIGCSESDDF